MNNKIGIEYSFKTAYKIGFESAMNKANKPDSLFKIKLEEYMLLCCENKLTEEEKHDRITELASIVVSLIYKETLPIMKNDKDRIEFRNKRDELVFKMAQSYKETINKEVEILKKEIEKDCKHNNFKL
jgi:hypothetical protein